jgi:hypothetical protein
MLAVFAMLGSGKVALAWVIVLFSIMNILVGVFTWFVLEDSTQPSSKERDRIRLSGIIKVLKMPEVWLISVVILSSYTAYWGLDFFTPYATEVFGMTVVFGGAIAVAKMWFKPIPAATAGFLADFHRFRRAPRESWLDSRDACQYRSGFVGSFCQQGRLFCPTRRRKHSLDAHGHGCWNHLRYRLHTGHFYARARRRSVGQVSWGGRIQVFVPFRNGNVRVGFIGYAYNHATICQATEKNR